MYLHSSGSLRIASLVDFPTRPKYESVLSLVGCDLESNFIARGQGK
jgi:hypothetical protein